MGQVEVHQPHPAATARHSFNMHFVFSRNGMRATMRQLGNGYEPTRQMAFEAHYVDRLAPSDHRTFHIQRYMATADAVGAWG